MVVLGTTSNYVAGDLLRSGLLLMRKQEGGVRNATSNELMKSKMRRKVRGVYGVSVSMRLFIYLIAQQQVAGRARHYITNPQSRGQPAGQGPARCLPRLCLSDQASEKNETGEVANMHEVTSALG